jgi:hypothetical protein
MAVQLTYTGTPFADQIRQQGFTAGKPTGGFGLRFADLFQRGPKTFTTPNLGVASLYGKTIPVASSTANLRLPSGAIPGKTFLESLKNIGGTKFGTEVIQTPKQATKGMDLASKLGTKYTGPTAAKLLAGKTVSGFGGVTPSLASKALGFTRGALFNPFGLAVGAGQGIGFLADQATKAMNTPEAYEFITNVTKNDPFAFDETNMDVGNIYTQQALLNNPENKELQELVAQGGGYNIPGITDRGGIIEATPFFSSDDIAARNVGVPRRDSRFRSIVNNAIIRPLMFEAGANVGLTGGKLLTGVASLPFAVAGGILSQFLPTGRSKPDSDYRYVNDPNNMGGLSVINNKIQDPSGILQGKNFESAFGSKNLGEMYDKALDKNTGYLESLGGVGELTEEELEALGLTTKEKNRRSSLLNKRQTIVNRLQDYLSAGPTIGNTGITYTQFARDYNKAQQNIGSNYDALDAQSYSSLGGGETTTNVGGQDITTYTDPYDRGGGE